MDINITLDQLIVWGIIGILAGSLAGMFLKRNQTGLTGLFSRLVIGLMGALIGGFLFDVLNLNLGLGQMTIAFEDLLAAFVGSLIFLVILMAIQK
jgi:uncharacterized membrane protein YeaQ/YmgE (transglycosylase-associated protein family)